VTTSSVRQPRWRVELYDVLSGDLSLAQVVAGTYPLPALIDTGHALDVTAAVADGLTLEAAGDKRADRLTGTLVEYTPRFDPYAGTAAKFLQPGQVVRVLEGDGSLDPSDWVYTFTGHIRGSVGFTRDRRSLQYQTALVAYGRRATPRYLKQTFTSKTYGAAVDYAVICNDVAAQQMGLSGAEVARFPVSLGKVTQFKANSIVEMTPLEAIDKILETVGQVSDFDGQGVLRTYSRDVRRGPDLVYDTLDLVFALRVAAQEIEIYNSVSVTGLDKNLTEVQQPSQSLARATIPVGFWRPSHTVTVPWSRDRSVRARPTALVIQTSVNDALFAPLGHESYQQLSDFDGRITVDISTYVYTLVAMITITLAIKAATADDIGPTPVLVDTLTGKGTTLPGGETIPVGRLAEAALLAEIFLALGTVSSGVYEIQGTTLIPVFKEISSVVTQVNVPDWAVHQKAIRSDWLNTFEELTAVAQLELLWETAQASPMTVELLDPYSVEVGDLLQLPDGRKLWVDSWRKTLGREQVPVLEVSGNIVPQGL
jgi:hypothetical protein